MVKAAQATDRWNLLLVDGLLLALCFSALTDLRLVAHSTMGTAALAAVALTAIVGSAVAEWKMLSEDAVYRH